MTGLGITKRFQNRTRTGNLVLQFLPELHGGFASVLTRLGCLHDVFEAQLGSFSLARTTLTTDDNGLVALTIEPTEGIGGYLVHVWLCFRTLCKERDLVFCTRWQVLVRIYSNDDG